MPFHRQFYRFSVIFSNIPIRTISVKDQLQLRKVCQIPSFAFLRGFWTSYGRHLQNENEIIADDKEGEDSSVEKKEKEDVEGGRLIVKDVDVETSIRYMNSKSYQLTYGDVPVWIPYRRNFKGMYLPPKTRKKCIRTGKFATGNPCPICRDEYLVVHYENVQLLQQFLSPHTGELLSYNKTGVCRQQHQNLQVQLEVAFDKGLIEMPVPFRKYDYSDYHTES